MGRTLAGRPLACNLRASNSIINALDIENFFLGGILISGDYNQIAGCYIGTDPSGNLKAANAGDGIFIEEGTDNVIGGATAGTGNLISGNAGNGIWINGSAAQRNQIEGNIIGANL